MVVNGKNGVIFDHTTNSVASMSRTNTAMVGYLCPDRLRYEQIGAADNLRGRVVRAFFFLMRPWKVP